MSEVTTCPACGRAWQAHDTMEIDICEDVIGANAEPGAGRAVLAGMRIADRARGMGFNEYQRAALRTANTDWKTLSASFAENPRNMAVANWAMGVAGEAGELCDYLKKCLFHGHQVDAEKVAKEAGDVLWYLAVLLEEYGLTLQEVAEKNEAKLRARYPEGFSALASVQRADVGGGR